MQYAVVTGISRGLGEAAAKLLLESGVSVIGISRRGNPALERCAKENNRQFIDFTCELSNLPLLEGTLEKLVSALFSKEEISSLYVINNAGMLAPIDRADHLLDAEQLAHHMHVNLVSPMTILNTLLKHASQHDVPLIGVNVTSGAAVRPHYGWSAYCSSKAGLDMYTKTVAVEQEKLQTDHKVIGFSPGIMDTGMQEQIRNTSEDQFHDVEKFRDFQKQSLLKRTDEVAGILIDILTDPGIAQNGKIYNVNDYL